MIYYLIKEDLTGDYSIFNTARKIKSNEQQRHVYEKEHNGIEKLNMVFELIQNDNYYPDFYSKAAYLFLAINCGHYFSNGNKRLSITCLFFFIKRNKFTFKSFKKDFYASWFNNNFPNFLLSENIFFRNFGWAFYNLAQASNIDKKSHHHGHEYTFDERKLIIEDFLRMVLKKD